MFVLFWDKVLFLEQLHDLSNKTSPNSSAKNFYDHRQKSTSAPAPTLEHGNPPIEPRPMFAGQLLDHGPDAFEAGLAAVGMGGELVAQETGGQVAQFGDGFVVGASVARDIDHFDRAGTAQKFEALAGGAFAQAEALNQVIHGQRACGDEEQTVDLGEGTGLAQETRKLDEEIN